jgi:hypothetical protein
MPRLDGSPGVLAKLYALSSSDPLLALIKIEIYVAGSITQTLRYVRDYNDLVNTEGTYVAAIFDLILPGESADQAPQTKLKIDVIDQALISILQSTVEPSVCTIQLVFDSDKNTPVYQSIMNVTSAKWNVNSAELTLDTSPVLDEPYPGIKFTPAGFPGLFEEN